MQFIKSNKQFITGLLACVFGAFFYCYELILRIIPGVLQSELSVAFGHLSAAIFGQIAALYYFAYSPMQLPVGMLMDRFGPRRLLTFACLCCTLGSYLFGFSNLLWLVGLGRFLVGFGSAFAFVGVLSLAVHWLPKRFFSLITGLVTTFGMLGVVYGNIKVTNLVAETSLHYALGLTVVLGAALSILILFVVRDGPGGVAVKAQPLADFFKQVWQVLISKQVWSIGLVGACLYTSLSVFGELWGKTYLEQAHHLSKIQAAEAISILFLGWALGAPLLGYLSDHFGKRVRTLVIGAVVSFIAISSVIYIPDLSFGAISCLLFVYGFASGSEIIVFIMAKENTGSLVSGTVFAVTNMIISLGGMIFQPVFGLILDELGHATKLSNGEFVYTIADYKAAMIILPISLVFVVIAGFFLKDCSHLSKHSH